MKNHNRISAVLLAGACLPATAGAQDLLIPDSLEDRVMLFSGTDGTLINDTYIDLTIAVPAPATPIEAIEVADEIWVSDQVADTVFRFSSDGTTFLGTTTMGRDNMRGIGLANGKLYATNSGSGGAGYGDACKEYALDGTLDNVFAVGDPFDVFDYQGTLLIANISGEDIDQYAYDGSFIGTFHDSDGVVGIDFPEQIGQRSNGNVIVGGFSSPSGIYEYDSSGAEVAYYDTSPESGVRGVAELENGLLLFTNNSGVFTYDIGSGAVAQMMGDVSGRFITRRGGGLGENYCTVNPNSTGGEAIISAFGSDSIAANDLTLQATPVPNQPFIFFYGPNQVDLPFGNGRLCVSGGLTRLLPAVSAINNFASRSVDTAVQGFVPGTVNFQCWFRDPAGGGSFYNTSDGVAITFVP